MFVKNYSVFRQLNSGMWSSRYLTDDASSYILDWHARGQSFVQQ